MRRLLVIAAAVFAFGSVHASPILVDPTATGSSVDAQITSSVCIGCFVDATLSDNLDAAVASLDVGDTFTFDFFDLTVGGLIGGAEFTVAATLALASPDAAADSEGLGLFASFLYVFNAVSLTWIQPDAIDLGDDTFLGVTFENLFEFGLGNTTTVSATITRFGNAAAVPEPGTAVLLVFGLLALWYSSRRRPSPEEGVLSAAK